MSAFLFLYWLVISQKTWLHYDFLAGIRSTGNGLTFFTPKKVQPAYDSITPQLFGRL